MKLQVNTKSFKSLLKCSGTIVATLLTFSLALNYNTTSAIIMGGLPSLETINDFGAPTITPVRTMDFTPNVQQNSASEEESSGGTIQGTGVGGADNGGFDFSTITLTEDERRYIANTVMHEVGSCQPLTESEYYGNRDYTPRCNVACCILIRYLAKEDTFGKINTIQGIITQPYAFSGISGYWNRTGYADEECFKAVDYVLAHGNQIGKCYWFRNKDITGWNSFFDGGSVKFVFVDSGPHSYYEAV